MEKTKDAKKSSTGRVKADKARIDRLKEQLRSTPQETVGPTGPVVIGMRQSC